MTITRVENTQPSEVLAGLIPVAFGFFLGFFLEPVASHLRKYRRRKRIAVILASEITRIKALTRQMTGIHKPILANSRKHQKQPNLAPAMFTDDADLPTSMYESIRGDIGLFDTDLIVLLSDLYNWIESAEHHRNINLRHFADYKSLHTSSSIKEGGPSPADVEQLRVIGSMTIHYAEAYVKCLDKILTLADEALKELSKIAAFEPTRESATGFDRPLKEESIAVIPLDDKVL